MPSHGWIYSPRYRPWYKPGDEVIVLEPCYDSYIPSIILAGAIPVRYQMKFPGYTIDWNEVKTLINPKTRMIMINTPHNPTGNYTHQVRSDRA